MPNFVGRETECETIITSLTSESTRLVNIYGSPGFGKTSTAISIGHRLHATGQPVYFFTFRGINSKNDFISKLLSFFMSSMASYLTPVDELCCFLKHISSRFFLILDNLDDLFANSKADGNVTTSVKDEVLQIVEEILMHCQSARILTTTRESLQFIGLKLKGNESVRIEPLDLKSCHVLVKTFLPLIAQQLSLRIIQICGNVPLAIKLLCSSINDDNQTPLEYLDEFIMSSRSITEQLDNSCHPNDLRLQLMFDSSFNRLSSKQQEGFISLSVFDGTDFDLDAAAAVIDRDKFQSKQTLKNLETKALIEFSSKNKMYSLHPLLQSFATEKGRSVEGEVVISSRSRFYEYYLNLFGNLNEQFLTDKAMPAIITFCQEEKSIWLSFYKGLDDEKLCGKVFNVLGIAELFLSALYLRDPKKIECLYDLALNKTKNCEKDFQARSELLVSKCFFQVQKFNTNGILVAVSKENDEQIYKLACSTTAKYLCYQGIYALSNERAEPGIQLIQKALAIFSNSAEQRILKVLSLHLLTIYYKFQNNLEKYTKFLEILLKECQNIGNMGLFLLDDSRNETGKNDEITPCPTSGYQPLILSAIIFLSFWGRNYLTTETKANFRDIAQEMLRQVEIALPSRDNIALATIVKIHDLAVMFLCEKNEAKIMEDTIRDIKMYLENENHLSQVEQQDSESEKRRKILLERLAWCYRSIGRNYVLKNQPSFAIKAYQQELEVSLELHGELHQTTASSCWKIGMEQQELGDYASALQSHQRALDIRLKLYGDQHADTATSYNNIGVVQTHMGNSATAFQSHQRALDIRLKLYGEQHAATANSYNNLGIVQTNIGDYTSALQSHRRALDIRLKQYGEQHADTADSYINLGIVQTNIGDYTPALKKHQRALATRVKLYGEQHGSTADSYNNIGVVHNRMGDYTPALQSHERALEIRLKLYGEQHEATATSHNNIGVVQNNMGNYESALQSHQRTLDIRLKLCGEQHGDTADSYENIASVQEDLKDYTFALQSHQHALDIRLKLYGEQNRDTATSYNNIGVVQTHIGNYTVALQSHQRALDVRLKLYGEQHAATTCSYNNIGVLRHSMGHYDSALRSFRRAHDEAVKLYGEQHHETIKYYKNIGIVERNLLKSP